MIIGNFASRYIPNFQNYAACTALIKTLNEPACPLASSVPTPFVQKLIHAPRDTALKYIMALTNHEIIQ